MNFTKNEEHLIRYFGCGQYLDSGIDCDRQALYRMMVENAFIRGEETGETKALRRVYKRLKEDGFIPLEEWDVLSKVEDSPTGKLKRSAEEISKGILQSMPNWKKEYAEEIIESALNQDDSDLPKMLD